jgi:hypothetical protein
MAGFYVKIDPSSIPNSSRLKEGVYGGVAEAINEVMKKVFAKSQELVPVETGDLRNSGVFKPASGDSGDGFPHAEITYGNASVTYAVFVHEELGNFHLPPTQAKYLETPLAQAHLKLMMAIARGTVKGAIKGWRQ